MVLVVVVRVAVTVVVTAVVVAAPVVVVARLVDVLDVEPEGRVGTPSGNFADFR